MRRLGGAVLVAGGAGTVAVVGAGTMGAGIAEVAARAGHPVLLLDAVPGAAASAVDGMRSRLGRDVAAGRLTEHEATAAAARVTVAGGLADLASGRPGDRGDPGGPDREAAAAR